MAKPSLASPSSLALSAGPPLGVAPLGVARLTGLSPVAEDESLPTKIADRIAESIISGVLAEGVHLREPELAVAFQTSRTPVREALRILERESLVTRLPRRGSRVSVIDVQRAFNSYLCRAYLYGLATKLACLNLTKAQLDELGRRLDEMRTAAERRDSAAYFTHHVRFHELVAKIADNELLASMIHNLGRSTMRLRFLSVTLPGRLDSSMALHEKLFVALQERDGVLAETIVRRFIGEAGMAVLDLHYKNPQLAKRLSSMLSLSAKPSAG